MTLGQAAIEGKRAILRRYLVQRYTGRVPVVWAYSVEISPDLPVHVGQGLRSAESWARRAGATEIVRDWVGRAVNPSYGDPFKEGK